MIFHTTSKRPIVIAGNGVRLAGAVDLLRLLYKKTRIPILTTLNSVDLISGDDRIGFIGTHGNRIANMIVAESDLIITIGARLGIRQVGNKREFFGPNAELIRVDIDESELSRNVKENETKYLMDAKNFLEMLLKEEIPSYNDWNERCFDAKKILENHDKQIGNLCIEEISKYIPPDSVVTVDVGQNQCWTAQSLVLKGSKGRILIGGGYGSMGCSIPYAIGACIANGCAPTFCICGDGGLQMNIQELQTIYSERLPIKMLIVNNQTLGKISETQRADYDRRMMLTTRDSGYTTPDFEKISIAYGIKSKTLKSYNELYTVKAWLEDEEPCLINIMLPDDTLLLPKMNWNEKEMKPLLSENLRLEVKKILLDE